MAYSVSKYKLICSFILFLVCAAAVLGVYNVNGVGWDFISHYLNARTLSTGLRGTLNTNSALSVGKNFYFDNVWEPLPTVIIAVLILLFNGLALPVYLVLLIALLFIASYITAKNLNVDPLLLSSVIVAPFMISYTILYNGNDILGSSFVLLAIGFIMAKQSRAGIFAGLMGLSKYASLFLLPLILFVGKRKDVLKAIALFILVTLPWLIFNYIAFGDPLLSYWVQLGETQAQSASIAMFLSTVFSIIWYPLAILICATVAIAYLEIVRKKRRAKDFVRKVWNFLKSRQSLVLLSFFVLAFLEFAFVYDKTQGPIRLGYMMYLSVCTVAIVVIETSLLGKIKLNFSKRKLEIGHVLPYIVFFISLALVLNLYLGWRSVHFEVLGSLGSKNPDFALASRALESYNLSECSIVSNAWPYMNYYNITTYSPYYCNSTVLKMPIVVFDRVGISNYCTGTVENLKNISQTFSYANFSIYLPNDYTCVK